MELLGVIAAATKCASYIRRNHVIVECDHQALKPLFFNKLRGSVDRWLTILQQNDLEIQYKPVGQMVVADALSRCHPNPDMPILEVSPDKHDSFDEPTRNIKLPSGECLDDLLQDRRSEVNDVQVNNIVIPFKPLIFSLHWNTMQI